MVEWSGGLVEEEHLATGALGHLATSSASSALRNSARGLLERGAALIGRSDAEFLLTELLHVRRHELYEPDTVVSPATAERFRELAQRAAQGTPVEYLIHTAVFLDFSLYVDERVLIPRSETEELVTRAVARLKESRTRGFKDSSEPNPDPRPLSPDPRFLPSDPRPPAPDPWPLTPDPRCLDLGTGSGCIAIALARALPEASIVATDISEAALETARLNVRRFGLEDRIELRQSDLFSAIGASGAILRAERSCKRSDPAPFDLIVSNPPYVPRAVLALLEPSVRENEPRIALDGGEDGMASISRIIQAAPEHMAPGALLAIEIDPAVAASVQALLPGAEIEHDVRGLARYCFWFRVETTDKHR